MSRRNLSLRFAPALMLLLFSLVVGCEDEPATGIGSYFEDNPYAPVERASTQMPTESEALAISPEVATLTDYGQEAKFEASGGVPPYNWSVQDISRGSIEPESRGVSSAVYERTAAGDNVVILEDSMGHRVLALVSQPAG